MSFRLFGIPVRIQPVFWLVAVMLGAPDGSSPRQIAELAVWVAVLFVSILVHELGHAIAMRAYGSSPSIELWGLGGLTHWGEGAKITPGRDIVTSLAGPAAGLMLGLLVLLLSRGHAPESGSLLAVAVRQALWINIAWGVVNLLPILPLDGGHVLESAGLWIFGPRGRRVAHAISLALAVAAAVAAFYGRQVWIGILALWCVGISWRRWSGPKQSAEAGEDVAPWIREGVREVWRLLLSGRAEDAAALASRLVERAPDTEEENAGRALALEALCWAQLELGNDDAALAAARRIPGEPSDLLRARLFVSEGRVEEGIAALEARVREERSSFPALVLSSVYIREERPESVLDLLRSPRGAELSSSTWLVLTAQLFHAEAYEACLDACRERFERTSEGVFAYNAACAASRLGRMDEGLDWLERAVAAGFSDAAQLDEDPDIEALRAQPRFEQIRTKL
jgi:Zn-dependent protease